MVTTDLLKWVGARLYLIKSVKIFTKGLTLRDESFHLRRSELRSISIGQWLLHRHWSLATRSQLLINCRRFDGQFAWAFLESVLGSALRSFWNLALHEAWVQWCSAKWNCSSLLQIVSWKQFVAKIVIKEVINFWRPLNTGSVIALQWESRLFVCLKLRYQ